MRLQVESTCLFIDTSSDPTIAEIVGVDGPDRDFLPDPGTHKIRIRKAGTVTITANQSGW